ncbi:LytR C-terminal domain-containing protein [Pseudarthrobacter sp. NIBRBAC000502770]|uniref:LytR C-terminal domain-containing protein n=1 Tax=Pseudarthrobacter sp. NIBRBAC000502770 TaxID=2590785 RepID=UPI00114005F4|nr:LytR C-terminal domain-containing protein [Pseudarthrobacter sp. NIBRBAC000502770]QDG87332.1 LytR family transcriptional regulator [Pseudarthrobacter sp. NIBRBAC000502770]
MTRYARDEFDKVPEAASRQGVHRTASAPSRVRLWPILAVGMAALAIGLVSFLILPKLGFNANASQASASVESAPLAGTGSTPTATQAAGSAATGTPTPSPSAGPTQVSEPAPTSSATQQAVVDRTQAVAVYNAAGTAGLASRVGGTVQADGWRLGPVGNWSGAPQKSSVIFYAGPQQLASAQQLAGLLNIPTVVSSTEFQVPLVVVLGPGYR